MTVERYNIVMIELLNHYNYVLVCKVLTNNSWQKDEVSTDKFESIYKLFTFFKYIFNFACEVFERDF